MKLSGVSWEPEYAYKTNAKSTAYSVLDETLFPGTGLAIVRLLQVTCKAKAVASDM